jgi:hypothetical protein
MHTYISIALIVLRLEIILQVHFRGNLAFKYSHFAESDVKPTTHLSNTLLAFQTEFEAEYKMLKPNKDNLIEHTRQK